MERGVTIVGMGQLGTLFGDAAADAGFSLTTVRRGERVAPEPVGEPILVAVGERDLADAIRAIPPARCGDIILIQNELFPAVWTEELGLDAPTVIVFWSNKKAEKPLQVGRRTAVSGPRSQLVSELHAPLPVTVEILDDDGLGVELVAKYAFILGINALGLIDNLTLGEWLERDPEQVERVMGEAKAVADALLGRATPAQPVLAAITDAMNQLSTMSARGRSAPARVAKANAIASSHGLSLEILERIQ